MVETVNAPPVDKDSFAAKLDRIADELAKISAAVMQIAAAAEQPSVPRVMVGAPQLLSGRWHRRDGDHFAWEGRNDQEGGGTSQRSSRKPREGS